MRKRRHGGEVVVLLALASLAIVVAACGGAGSATPPSSTTRPTTTSTSAPDPEERAVLAGYRSAWAAFEQAGADANPQDPALAATMVDPQLTSVRAHLLADQQQGVVGRGTVTLHPKVTKLAATTATVADCAYSADISVYKATGKQVPPVTRPENDGVTATLVLTDGVWKVAKQTVTDGKCSPGS